MDRIVEAKNITKDFIPPLSLHRILKSGLGRSGATRALDDISFSLESGGSLCVLGPNGAGKTTLLKIISTLVLPDKGSVVVGGHDVEKNDLAVRSMVGLASSDERSFYWRLTGRQNLEFFASLHGLSRKEARKKIDGLFGAFRVNYEDKRFDSYSTGMKRKFELMRALIHDPALLLLDEPAKSLDMMSSRELMDLVKKMSKEGKTVILATHDIAEAEELCDTFLILREGALCGYGTLEDLGKKTGLPGAGLGEIYMKATSYVA